MLKVQLSQQGKALFRLMNSPCARAGEAVMAIVRETLSISADAATPLRSAALDEGIIVKHLLIALQPATAKTLSTSANGAPRWSRSPLACDCFLAARGAHVEHKVFANQ